MKMPAMSFSMFKEKLISGDKCTTIRLKRKRPLKEGQILYVHWRQRSQEHEYLGSTIIREIRLLTVYKDKIFNHYLNRNLTKKELLKLAKDDGFASLEDFFSFFRSNYRLPRVMTWIRFDPIQKKLRKVKKNGTRSRTGSRK